MISIHQSQFLPWVPYFFKILKSDVFVLLDDVQFQKNGVQNRNLIKTSQGAKWCTIPVRVKLGAAINGVQIADINTYTRILKTLELNYKRSIYFQQINPIIKKVLFNKFLYLDKLNKELLREIIGLLEIRTNIFFSSSIKTMGKKDDLVIEIIKNFNEKEYLCGSGGLKYMDLDKFRNAGIKVYVYKFKYAEYSQLWSNIGFISDLSIIDLLYNNYENSVKYISENGSFKEIV